MKGYFKGKKIDNIEIDGIDMHDYPDFVDAYISYATYENGIELNDDELEELNNDSSQVYSLVMQYLY